MRRNNRAIAFALAGLLVLALLLPSVFLAAERNHVCTGLDCAVCEQLARGANLLLALACMLLAAAFAVSKLPFVTFLLTEHARSRGVFSLVSLKVKLSD